MTDEKDDAGNLWEYSYVTTLGVSQGQLASVETPDPDASGPENPYISTYSYTAKGQLLAITHPDSSVEEFTRVVLGRAAGQVGWYTDRLGNRTEFDFDSTTGKLLRTRQVVGTEDAINPADPYNTLGSDPFTTFEYDTTVLAGVPIIGLPSAIFDPRGVKTEFAYNHRGQVTKETYAANFPALEAELNYSYDLAGDATDNHLGWLRTITNELGYIEQFDYDNLGRLTRHKQIDPDGDGLNVPEYTYKYDRSNRLKSIKDPILRETQYVYQANGPYTEVLPDHDFNSVPTVTTFTMDARGRLWKVMDAMHYTTELVYNDIDQVTDTKYPRADNVWALQSGQWVETNAGTEGKRPITSSTYDALGRLSTETDARDKVTNYFYSLLPGSDSSRVEVWQPSPDESSLARPITRSTFDANGNLTLLEEGSVPWNATSSATRTISRQTRFVYDQLGRLTDVYRTQPTAVGSPTTEYLAEHFVYDKNGNLTQTQETIDVAAGTSRTTTFEYDERNRMTKRIDQDPDQTVSGDRPEWVFGYDAHNRLTSVTDPLLRVTNFGYDRLDRQTSITLPDPDGATGPLVRPVYSTQFDAVGRVSKTIDPKLHYTTYFYDALSDNWTVFDNDGDGQLPADSQRVTRYRYDANQRMIASWVNNGRTTYERDALGQVTKVTQPDPDTAMTVDGAYTNTGLLSRPFTTYTYDNNGNLETSTNELGKVTTHVYDFLNRLTTRIDPDPDLLDDDIDSPVTSYSYDTRGNLLTLTDPASNMTTWHYDLLDRMDTETIVLGGANKTRSYEYDLLGNLTKSTDRLNRVINYQYDRLGRNTREDWTTTAVGAPITQSYEYSYYADSTLKTADGSFQTGTPSYFSEYDYTYNAAGWLETETLKQASLLKTTFTHGYNESGQRTNLKTKFATNSTLDNWLNDFQNDYTYDSKGRQATVKQYSQSGGNNVASKFVKFGYNDLDQVIDIDRYAYLDASDEQVAHSVYDRDYLGRIKNIDHSQGTTHFATYDIAYDDRSRIESIDEVFSNTNWNEQHDFTYDDTDQLKTANHSVRSDEAYAYDANGNRTGNQTLLGETKASTVDQYNRITSDGTYTYTYDAEGNMTTKKLSSDLDGPYEEYFYDHRNRLTSVIFKASPTASRHQDVAYRYDHANRLIRRIYDEDGAGAGLTTNRFYIHDGNQIVQIFDRATTGTATLSDRLLWGPEQDMLISDERVTSLSLPGTTYWALLNHLNSVIDVATYDLTTNAVTIVEHRSFDGFGNITLDSVPGTITIVFGYTGKLLDSTTGLQNNINRWYTSWLGKWITEDPIGFAGGDENLRRYVGNSPTNFTDPSGLQYRDPRPQLILEGGPQGSTKFNSSKIQALYNRGQSAVSKLDADDPRLMFLAVQQKIILALDNELLPTLCAKEHDWLERVLSVFMNSLLNSLDDRMMRLPGKGVTQEEVNADMRAFDDGKLGGYWWRSALNMIKELPPESGRKQSDPTNAEAAGVIMAFFHINFDLKMALIKEGIGTDDTWQCIGNIVERESKAAGRGFPNFLLAVGRIFPPLTRLIGSAGTVDPVFMRDKMRADVKQHMSTYGVTDPLTGLPPDLNKN